MLNLEYPMLIKHITITGIKLKLSMCKTIITMPISERFKIVFNIKGNCDVFLDADIESPFYD